jgi:hypothetical protein
MQPTRRRDDIRWYAGCREASQTSFDEEVSGYADGKYILRCAWAISALASVGYATVAAGCVCVSVRRPSAAAGSTVRVQPIPTSVWLLVVLCVSNPSRRDGISDVCVRPFRWVPHSAHTVWSRARQSGPAAHCTVHVVCSRLPPIVFLPPRRFELCVVPTRNF